MSYEARAIPSKSFIQDLTCVLLLLDLTAALETVDHVILLNVLGIGFAYQVQL